MPDPGEATTIREALVTLATHAPFMSGDPAKAERAYAALRLKDEALKALDLLLARLADAERALIRCAELSGEDGEAVEAARSGALNRPSIAVWAVECVAQLRLDYDGGAS